MVTTAANPPATASKESIAEAARESALPAWRLYTDQAVAVLQGMPVIPRAIWLCGAVGIVLLMALQVLVCRLRLRGSFAAPDAVGALVAGAARDLGIRRVPRVIMVPDRVSPMIWCGVRPRLVLPAELWDELDDLGRRAVVHHELAHLKRRDHWLCWVEMGACIVYWWHPLVWWVRLQIREEADLCCDAWVTAMMPRQRRAYAEALLHTQKFLGGARVPPTMAGLGVISGGAKRFARRLTMVMTQRSRPQRSFSGVVMAILVGVAGMASAALACPPEDEEKARQARHQAEHRAAFMQVQPTPPRPPRPAQAPRAAAAPRPPKPPTATIAPRARGVVIAPESGGHGEEHDASTFERHMRERGQVQISRSPAAPRARSIDPQSGGSDARLEQLERRMDRMEERIDRMIERLAGCAPLTPPRRAIRGGAACDRATSASACSFASRSACSSA